VCLCVGLPPLPLPPIAHVCVTGGCHL